MTDTAKQAATPETVVVSQYPCEECRKRDCGVRRPCECKNPSCPCAIPPTSAPESQPRCSGCGLEDHAANCRHRLRREALDSLANEEMADGTYERIPESQPQQDAPIPDPGTRTMHVNSSAMNKAGAREMVDQLFRELVYERDRNKRQQAAPPIPSKPKAHTYPRHGSGFFGYYDVVEMDKYCAGLEAALTLAREALEEIRKFAIYGCGTMQKDRRGAQFSRIIELSDAALAATKEPS